MTTPIALPPVLRDRLTVSVEEAGTVLGISRGSAYEAARTGELPTFKIGRRIVVPVHRLLELIGLPADAA